MKKLYLYQSNVFDAYGSFEAMEKYYREARGDELGLSHPYEGDVNSNDVFEYFATESEYTWRDFIGSLPIASSGKTYLVRADVGRWNGRFEGGKVITGLESAFDEIISGEDDFEIYFENRTLKVDTHNHDASSYFEIYELSDKGLAYNDIHSGFYADMDDRELHKRLRECGRSRNVAKWL